jgi:hypothetical protein
MSLLKADEKLLELPPAPSPLPLLPPSGFSRALLRAERICRKERKRTTKKREAEEAVGRVRF